jgi:hypothetical protein
MHPDIRIFPGINFILSSKSSFIINRNYNTQKEIAYTLVNAVSFGLVE